MNRVIVNLESTFTILYSNFILVICGQVTRVYVTTRTVCTNVRPSGKRLLNGPILCRAHPTQQMWTGPHKRKIMGLYADDNRI